jgi:hypothetical protein
LSRVAGFVFRLKEPRRPRRRTDAVALTAQTAAPWIHVLNLHVRGCLHRTCQIQNRKRFRAHDDGAVWRHMPLESRPRFRAKRCSHYCGDGRPTFDVKVDSNIGCYLRNPQDCNNLLRRSGSSHGPSCPIVGQSHRPNSVRKFLNSICAPTNSVSMVL